MSEKRGPFSISKREIKMMIGICNAELALMADTLRDPGFSRRQHKGHVDYCREIRNFNRRLRRLQK
jgi:hypothetical protein